VAKAAYVEVAAMDFPFLIVACRSARIAIVTGLTARSRRE